MKTDKQIFKIFQAEPQWVYLLAGEPSPGPCRFESKTFKEIEKRTDGLLVPEVPNCELWIEQRLCNKGKKEIEEMLIGQLPDLRDTQSGKDLIAIGKAEGKVEGKIEGKVEGKIEGKAEGLVKLLEIRFGKVTAALKKQLASIESEPQLDRLYEHALSISKLADFKVKGA